MSVFVKDEDGELLLTYSTYARGPDLDLTPEGRNEGRYEYPTGNTQIATGFPFGLWRARHRVAIARRCLVWPRTVPVGPVPAGAYRYEFNVANVTIIDPRNYATSESVGSVHSVVVVPGSDTMD